MPTKAELLVLAVLKRSKIYLTQREIAEKAKVSQPVVSRTLSLLRDEGRLQERITTFPLKYKLDKNVIIPDTDLYEPDLTPTGLNSEQMFSFLEKWAQAAWEPKVVKSLHNLPHAIAGLYSLAVEETYGADITKQDIYKVMELVSEARQDIIKVLEVIDRIVSTKEAWDPVDMTLFLTDNRDIEKIQRLIHRIRSIN